MKTFLSFIVILFLTLLCKAFPMQGLECFCHDTPNVQFRNNNCWRNIVQLLNNQNNLFNLQNNTYSWILNGVLNPQDINLNPLPLQQQATFAIARFCIGITNNRPLPAFQDLRALVRTYVNGAQNNLVHALAAGGYNSPSAQFLHALFAPGGIPLNLVVNDNVGIILKLQRRASKNLKEIHWSSSSAIAVNLKLWGKILHEVIQQNRQQLQQLFNANQNFLNLLQQNAFQQLLNESQRFLNLFQPFFNANNVLPFNAFQQFLQQNAQQLQQLLNANQNLLNLLQQQQNAQPQLLALQQLLNEQRLFLNAPQPQYVSIKQRINRPFNILNQQVPNSATFVLYEETSHD